MKNIFLITTVITLFTLNSYCQLDEKTWLVGGTGSFNSFKTIESTTVQYLTSTETIKIQRNSKVFEINPKLGFFIIDKLVLGLSLTFTNEKSNSITLEGNSSGGISNSKFLYPE